MQTYPRNLLTKFKIVDRPSEFFYQLDRNDELAIAASYEETLYPGHAAQFSAKNRIYCFDFENIIYGHSMKMLTRKDFPLLNDLNDFMQRANECGLINKWLKSYRPFYDGKLENDEPTVTIESLMIEFVIYGCMMFVAFVTIFIEKETFKRARAPNPPPVWRYFDMLIDPYRYFFLTRIDFRIHTFADIFSSREKKYRQKHNKISEAPIFYSNRISRRSTI